MIRTLPLLFLLLISACKAMPISALTQEESLQTLIQIEERGGFMGVFGPYNFSTSGTLYYKGDSLRALKTSERNTVDRQVSLIRALAPYQATEHSVERSLRLFSSEDTLIFNWDLEEEKAAEYNAIYRRLSQLVNK
jgi:hypothetical protein